MKAGRELDALLAEKVMGLTGCKFHEVGSISGMMTIWECEHSDSSRCFATNKEAMEHPHSPLARYSTDIAAAWQVVEHLLWHPETVAFLFKMDSVSLLRLSASEAAEAICLAALKAVGVDVEKEVVHERPRG